MPVLSGDGVVSVEAPARQISVEAPPAGTASVAVIRGAAGPAGPPGVGTGVEVQQSTPAATWIFAVPVGFGRTPSVDIYVAGELVDADVTADSTTVSIQFPSPAVGSVVLT